MDLDLANKADVAADSIALSTHTMETTGVCARALSCCKIFFFCFAKLSHFLLFLLSWPSTVVVHLIIYIQFFSRYSIFLDCTEKMS
jgi:hypothetical protein